MESGAPSTAPHREEIAVFLRDLMRPTACSVGARNTARRRDLVGRTAHAKQLDEASIDATSDVQSRTLPSALFRPQAVEHHAAAAREGDILRLDARWPAFTYHLVW